MALFLGVDIGTQSAKALVYDADSGTVVGRGSYPFEVDSPRPGAAEQDPLEWLAGGEFAIAQALSAAGDRAGEVAGIGVSGQQHGCVVLDEDDQPIRPAKLWCDTEAATESAELSDALGRSVPAGFTAPKLLWLQRHEPRSYARVRRVLLPHDWFNLHLGGDAFTEAGDASGTGYFDPAARTYDADAVAQIDPALAGWIPEIVGADRAASRLRPALAERLGLAPETVVAPGSGDNMMSALGAGAVEAGTVVVSLGTSGTIFGPADHPVVDPAGAIAPFCDATGQWLPLLCTMNCTTVTEEVRAAFDLPHDTLTALAEAEPVGCEGLRFLPYLQGERVPDWPRASGVLHGLRPGSLRPGLLFRAAMEGANLALLLGYRRLQELGVHANELRVVGGAARNPLWRRMLADLFATPLRFPAEAESAALGGALQAAAIVNGATVREWVAAHPPPLLEDRVEPNGDATADYAAVAEEFASLGMRLFG